MDNGHKWSWNVLENAHKRSWKGVANHFQCSVRTAATIKFTTTNIITTTSTIYYF